jgi:hypothetical protein
MSISQELKREIRELAENCCEYCRMAEDDRASKFQIDHIIPVKHGGRDVRDNLCLACLKCNAYKGPNGAALDPQTGDATKLYSPRAQRWEEHFSVEPNALITGLTPEGRATVEVLRMNETSRVRTRRELLALMQYPC